MRQERRAGRAHSETVTFPVSLSLAFLLLFFFSCSHLFRQIWEEGEGERHGNLWVAVADAGRGWDLGKSCNIRKYCTLPRPSGPRIVG